MLTLSTLIWDLKTNQLSKNLEWYIISNCFRDYGDGGGDEDGERNKPKVTIRETLGEDGIQAKLTNITGNVAGKLGNVMGKGIGGLSKFGGGSWF